MNDLMNKYADVINGSLMSDMSVDSANLLSAGKHICKIGKTDFVESKESQEWADRTPQLMVRFYNSRGIFTRWFPLLGYTHFSKLSPSQIEDLNKQYGEENVLCVNNYLVINNIEKIESIVKGKKVITEVSNKTRVVSMESGKECQKRIKDLCYALQITDSELADETGKSSIGTLMSAIDARIESKAELQVNLFDDKEGRVQLGGTYRVHANIKLEKAIEVEQTEQLG